MRRFFLPLTAVALLAACDTPGGPAPVVAPTPAAPAPVDFPRPTVLPPAIPPSAWQEEQAVAVDLAVHQFQFLDTRLPWPPLYFLGRSGADQRLPWSDPPAEVLLRFAGHQPRVKPVSACRVEPLGAVPVMDLETGVRGVVFLLGPRAWVSETEVVVTGGYYENGISSNWNTYRVRLAESAHDGRRWVVVQVQREWIS